MTVSGGLCGGCSLKLEAWNVCISFFLCGSGFSGSQRFWEVCEDYSGYISGASSVMFSVHRRKSYETDDLSALKKGRNPLFYNRTS